MKSAALMFIVALGVFCMALSHVVAMQDMFVW